MHKKNNSIRKWINNILNASRQTVTTSWTVWCIWYVWHFLHTGVATPRGWWWISYSWIYCWAKGSKQESLAEGMQLLYTDLMSQNSRFLQWHCWKFRSSEMWCCVVWWVVSGILKDCSVFIFRIKFLDYTWSWCWRCDDVLNWQELQTRWQRITALQLWCFPCCCLCRVLIK